MNAGEQISLFDLGICSSKMYQDFSLPIMERTSELSSKRPAGLSTPTPMFLDLRKDRPGAEWGAFWETDGLSLGEYTTVSFGECPKDAVDCALWQILEVNPLPKYSLSAKACQGILNRAENRGKELPPALRDALINQISRSRFGGGCEVDSKGNKAGKGALIQTELSATLGVTQDQTLFTNIPTCYGISPYDSNAMKSPNPHSGIYEADTSRTLDLNGATPSCNQGGMVVLENHPADSRVKIREDGIVQTLNGQMGTGGNNVPMLLLTEDHYGDYNESDTAASLRKSGGTLGGGWRVSRDTVGALQARDYKGVGDQYVREGKVIIQQKGEDQ